MWNLDLKKNIEFQIQKKVPMTPEKIQPNLTK